MVAEKRRTWRFGCRLVQEPAHRGKEAHVGHAVRLVEHHGRDLVEEHVASFDEVLEAARTGHHDVDALVECAHLVAVSRAAEDGDDPLAIMPEQVSDDIVHLGGQLACRHEDQCPRAARARLHGADDERDPERKRLARSRRRLSADVPARERRGDRL